MAQDFRNIVLPKTWTIEEVVKECQTIGLKDDLVPTVPQLEGLKFMLNNNNAILAHEMGLGKTLQALLLILIDKKYGNKKPALVLCTLPTSYNWVKECVKCFVHPPSILRYKTTNEYESYRWNPSIKKMECQTMSKVTTEFINEHDIVVTHYHALTGIWNAEVVKKIKEKVVTQTAAVATKTTTTTTTTKRESDWEMNIGSRLHMLKEFFPEFRWPDSNRVNRKILDIEIIPGEISKRRVGPILAHSYHRLIVDEAHNMRNPKTLLATMSYAISAQYRVCMTGTPKINKDPDVWSLLHILRVPNLISMNQFKEKAKYMMELKEKRASLEFRITNPNQDYMVQSTTYIEELYTKYMHRVTKKELTSHDNKHYGKPLDDRTRASICVQKPSSIIPSGIYVREISVEMSPAAKAAYEEIRKARFSTSYTGSNIDEDGQENNEKYGGEDFRDGVDTYGTSTDNKKSKVYMFSTITILRKMCCDASICLSHMNKYCQTETRSKARKEIPAKFEAVLKYLQQSVLPHEKVVIVCYFKDACKKLAAFLKRNKVHGEIYVITSETKRDEKTNYIEAMQNKTEARHLIATMCISLGINLTSINHCIILCPWWNDAEDQQMWARLHRMGQKNHVLVVYFVMKDTIDERIREVAKGKGTIPTTRELMRFLGMDVPVSDYGSGNGLPMDLTNDTQDDTIEMIVERELDHIKQSNNNNNNNNHDVGQKRYENPKEHDHDYHHNDDDMYNEDTEEIEKKEDDEEDVRNLLHIADEEAFFDSSSSDSQQSQQILDMRNGMPDLIDYSPTNSQSHPPPPTRTLLPSLPIVHRDEGVMAVPPTPLMRVPWYPVDVEHQSILSSSSHIQEDSDDYMHTYSQSKKELQHLKRARAFEELVIQIQKQQRA